MSSTHRLLGRSTRRRSALSRRVAVQVSLALATAAVSLAIVPGSTVGAASNGLTVQVFDDHDFDGVRSDGAATPSASDDENGVAGVTVRVFGDDDPTGVSGLTAVDGSVTFAAAVLPANDQVRIEVDESTLPAGFRAGPTTGGGNALVGFADLSAGPVTVDVGVQRPYRFCESNPDVAITCQVAGDPTDPGFAASAVHDEAIVRTGFDFAGMSVDATVDGDTSNDAIGSVWGLAWDQARQSLYSAAFMKRTAGFGDGGIGGIYVTDYDAGTTSLLVDLAPVTNLAADEVAASNANRALGPTPGAEDETGFLLTGKAGLGDIEIDPVDGDTLYVVNAFDRVVHTVDISGTPSVGTLPAYPASCAAGTDRPWGLEWHDGSLYLGVVCDGSEAVILTTRFVDPPPVSLTAEVLRYDIAAGTWSTAMPAFSLGYARGGVHRGTCDYWGPWTDDPSHQVVTQNDPGFMGRCAPQPLLADIEFDADGSMVLGFVDRGAHQFGARVATPVIDGVNAPNQPPSPVVVVNGGDILRAESIGALVWTLENAGTDLTLSGCAGVNGDNRTPNGEGPGGGEYYCDDWFFDHDQTALGGLATADRFGEVLGTIIDPNAFESGGISAFNDITGLTPRRVELYADVLNDGANNTFNKGAGLGDLDLLCAAAPIQVGEYLWYDADGDGVQDPSELALEGVTVHLLDAAGAPVLGADSAPVTATTDADGRYLFGGLDPSTLAASGPQSLLLAPATAYQLAFDTSTLTTALPGGLTGDFLEPTLSDGGANDGQDSDVNATASVAGTVLPAIAFSTAAAGENDASLDAGFVDARNRIGNLVWLDLDDDAVVDVDEPGVGGLTVDLYVESGAVAGFDATDQMSQSTTTNADGQYWFEQVGESEVYYVAIPTDQAAATIVVDGVTLDAATLRSSTGGNLADNDVDNVDDGDPAAGFLSVSGPIGLTEGAEATAEVDTNVVPNPDAEAAIQAAGATTLLDADSNLTVDLGLVQTNRIGNLVWLDGVVGEAGFNNGIADPAEVGNGIAGVTVELYLDDPVLGTPGTYDAGIDTAAGTTTTDAAGAYWFEELVAGDYFVAIPAAQTGQNVGGTPVDLAALSSSSPTSSAPGVDDVDDGTMAGGFASLSSVVTVGAGPAPVDEAGDFGDATVAGAETAANLAGAVHVDATSDLTIDMGFVEVPLYSIGNLVWFDIDDDGVAEAGEPGIEGVDVELWLDGGVAAAATTTTDVDGHYQFDDLVAGDYVIVIPGAQTGQTIGADTVDLDTLFVSSTFVADPDAAGDADNDSNGFVSGAAVTTGVVSVGDPDQFSPTEPVNETLRADDATDDDAAAGDGQRNLTVDIGYVQPVRVGNLVWLDNGGGVPGDAGYTEANEDNGVADTGESGVAGVLVQLLDGATVVAETVTDGNGNYWFDDLRAGTFEVAIPTDQTPTLGAQPSIVIGATDALRSSTGQSLAASAADDDDDGDPATGFLSRSSIVTIGYGLEATDEAGDFADATAGAAETAANAATAFRPDNSSNLEVDLGLSPVPGYRIGNLVWEDYDDDGLAEAGEPGIEGVLVQLLETGVVVAETVTDADGAYAFAGLDAGDYQVRVPASQTPALAPQPTIVAGALDGLTTSGTPTADPDAAGDTDHDNDGVGFVVGATSGVLTVGEGDDNSELLAETLRSDNATTVEDGLIRDDRSNLGVDIGFFRGLRLGNQIFRDGVQGEANFDNGVFDPGETGIGGATVELWLDDGDGVFEPTTDDTLADSVLSDAEGNYVFEGLDAGVPMFVAVASVPNGLASTVRSATPTTADNDNDGGPDAGYASVTSTITLAVAAATTGEADAVPAADGSAEAEADLVVGAVYPDANSELAVDLGFIDVPLYRVGNLVWHDLDNDGVAEAGEPGIEGVLVQLFDDSDSLAAETVTDVDGHYRFENFLLGTYRVAIPMDQASLLGTTGIVAGALDGFVSSAVGEEADPNLDVDNNDNGLIAATEWTSGAIDLGPATLTPPLTTEPTTETLRSDDATDDDPDVGVAGSYPDSYSNLTVDFGFHQLTLGSQVWFDSDADGVLDPTEPGINGVTVNVYEDVAGSLTLVDSTVTATINGVDGSYLFTGLVDGGTYVVEIPATEFDPAGPLAGTVSSPGAAPDPDDDPTDGDDNGVDPATAGDPIRSLPVTLVVGGEPLGEAPDLATGVPDANENLTVDFGVTSLELGGSLWSDVDENGLFDGAETALAGVPVELWAVDGAGAVTGVAPLASTTTAGDGSYSFVGLVPGDYVVRVPATALQPGGPLAGQFSTPGTGAVAPDPDVDPTDGDDNGDADEANGWVQAAPVTLAYGAAPTLEAEAPTAPLTDAAANATIDFGFVPTPPLSLGNRVFEDLDNSGLLDGAEAGLAGVTVELINPADSTVLATELTDADGYYLFEGLLPGDYVVRIPASNFSGVLAGFHSSNPAAPADPDDDPTDSDDNGVDPVDFGADVDSAPVSLFPSTEPTEAVEESDVPASGHGSADDIDSNLTVDFGFYQLSLGNRIWDDADNSGTLDAGEAGLAGVSVQLLDANTLTIVATSTTDADGYYLFTGIAEGDYLVQVPAAEFASSLNGYYSSTGNGVALDPDGTPGAGIDSDDNGDPVDGAGSAVRSLPIRVTVGAASTGELDAPAGHNVVDANSELTVDLGFYSASLSSAIWNDVDNDGVQDAGEAPLGSVVLELVDPATGQVLATATTAADGSFVFDGLEEGRYVVTVVAANFAPGGPLAGLVSTSGTPGSDAGNDPVVTGTASFADVSSDPIDVVAGPTASLAFGFAAAGSIGDRVWNDQNANGVQDAGEPGLAGVTVRLLDAAGTQLATTETAADGSYRFENLPTGSYIVATTAPEGFTLTVRGSGSVTDSDVDPVTGQTAVIVLAVGEDVVGIDIGMVSTTPALAFTGAGWARWLGGIGIGLFGLGLMLMLIRNSLPGHVMRR